jgi:6,7-dimethyl-8-ribityllumazine synthase
MSLHNPIPIKLNKAPNRTFGIVAARFNQHLVDKLLATVVDTLTKAGVPQDNIEIIRVPGSNEIPYAVNALGEVYDFDCIIALGVIIAGQTDHHKIIAQSTSKALQTISIEHGFPIINGILSVQTYEQAQERCSGKINQGEQIANAACEMANLRVQFDQRTRDQDQEQLPFFENFGQKDLWDDTLDQFDDDDFDETENRDEDGWK